MVELTDEELAEMKQDCLNDDSNHPLIEGVLEEVEQEIRDRLANNG